MTREEARKNLKELYMHLQTSPAISAKEYRTAVKLAIEALQERPKGRWIEMRDAYGKLEGWLCECGRQVLSKDNFCPNCGADMQGEQE